MTLDEVKKEIISVKTELAKVPAIEARLHHLQGMEEILSEQENEKPELKVAQK